MKDFKEALWKIIRNEGIVVNNQNLDWLLERAEKLLINENKSNNFDVKSNEELFKQALVEGLNRRFDREIEEAKKIEQIEEMAKVIKSSLDVLGYGNFNFTGDEISTMFAQAFYNAGYRKQSEGEWVRQKGSPEAIYSNCGRDVVYQAIDNKWAFENYCPHCGAKMKGGVQE